MAYSLMGNTSGRRNCWKWSWNHWWYRPPTPLKKPAT